MESYFHFFNSNIKDDIGKKKTVNVELKYDPYEAMAFFPMIL